MKLGPLNVSPLSLLLVFVPIAIGLEVSHADPLWIFACSCMAIIPLAGLMGESTEHLSAHVGPGVGGLLNATFGNAAELIIALMALKEGLHEVVKASLTGSIIGNILLVLGLSFLAGGVKFKEQRFNKTAANMGSTMLALSAIGLVLPSIFIIVAHKGKAPPHLQDLSLWISIVLLVTYVLSLIFSLKTHAHLYEGEEGAGHHHGEPWSKGKAIAVLLGATVFVALMSEFLVGSVEHAAKQMGMTELFVGVVLVAIIGNAAEHSTAVLMAMKNQMDLAINIAIGSSMQIALFVAPVLVLVSYVFGKPMDLHFEAFEVISVAISVAVVNMVTQDGESNWMEGTLLVAVYILLGVTFYFHP